MNIYIINRTVLSSTSVPDGGGTGYLRNGGDVPLMTWLSSGKTIATVNLF
jgi:hypothetical protein